MANPQPDSWEYEGPVDYMKILARKREIPKEVGAELPLRNPNVDILSSNGASLGKPLDHNNDIEQKLSENFGDSAGRSKGASSISSSIATHPMSPQMPSSSSQQFPSAIYGPVPHSLYAGPPGPRGLPSLPSGPPILKGIQALPSGPPPPKGNPPLPPGPPPPKGNPPLPPGPPPKPAIVSDFRKAAPVPDSVKGPAPPPASVSAFRNPPPFASRPAHPLGFLEGVVAIPSAGQAAPEQRKPQRRPRGFSLSSNFRRTVDSYERVCQVGGGTYGDVFKARDRETGDIVALKKVRLENEMEGFPVTALREIKFLSQMSQADNPNIVKLKEVVTSKASDATRNKGSVFMVFEYAECDLVGLMKSRKLSEPHIMCLLKQLLEAVHVAHVNQVLHRDIKPSNVLVNSRGILKLADWGLCRKWIQGNKYTNRVVTLWYRAPELLLGEQQYTTAIDMWAVGCLMAELLIGRALFPGKDEVNQLKLILELCGKPAKDQLPAGWENLLLAKDFLFGEATPSQMQMRFAFLRPQAKDLIFRLLELDPSKRISARDALSHDYFWGTDPAPCDPSFLPIPKGDGLHEYQLREEQARKHQEASSHHDKRWKA